jgi:uncharacterized membrane protein YdjX (TVP38/TMEM64 family)
MHFDIDRLTSLVMKKLLMLFVIAVLAYGFFAFDLNRHLSIDSIKASLGQFEKLRAASPLGIGIAFFVIYVMVSALALPGTPILTLTAGALFGFLLGTVLVSFASSIGATMAFLASRYLLRDVIQHRFGDRLKLINERLRQNGTIYLFTLRLLPFAPFFLINLLMGLTPIRTFNFYWVSQLGMLASTLVYINAGTQLVKVKDLSSVASPELLISLALLGVFPILAKNIIKLIRTP